MGGWQSNENKPPTLPIQQLNGTRTSYYKIGNQIRYAFQKKSFVILFKKEPKFQPQKKSNSQYNAMSLTICLVLNEKKEMDEASLTTAS